MNCPVCKTPMLVVEHQGIELDHCPECRGTWFDREELELLFARALPDVRDALPDEAESLPEAQTREKRRRCPLCRKKMRKVYVGRKGKVLIDICPRGEGMWFDSEEVASLAAELSATEGAPPDTSRAIEFLGGLFGGPPAEQQNGRE